jgi:hypothetical protein
MHVMVGGAYRLLPTGHPASRERANLHLGLGIERDAERLRVPGGSGVDVSQMVEDGIGLGNFF